MLKHIKDLILEHKEKLLLDSYKDYLEPLIMIKGVKNNGK